jgi:hypothetical protein
MTIYYEINFSRFYYPFQHTEDGWVFGFLRKRIESEPYNLATDEDFLKELNEERSEEA